MENSTTFRARVYVIALQFQFMLKKKESDQPLTQEETEKCRQLATEFVDWYCGKE